MSQKLRPEAKEKVLEALRSERYKQGIGHLHSLEGDTWCCLGVATDAACEDGVDIRRAEGRLVRVAIEFFDGYSQYLPSQVAEWLGLEANTDDLLVVLDDEFFDSVEDSGPWSQGEKVWLAELNDGGVPFDAIAGLIERQW